MTDRRVFRIAGDDRIEFLQNLVTNDLVRLKDGLVWAALLTPQGKYLADFFLVQDGEAVLLDVAGPLADDLIRRLSMYKLRAKVTIAPTEIAVARGVGALPEGAFADPRHPSLGWRAYDGRASEAADWDGLRVAAGVPESGVELVPNESFPLEMGFERLSGVDFRKGCYVGQEVTARMKHKTELRKGLARVGLDGQVPVGVEIVTSDGKAAGTIYTQANGEGLAYLRFDRAGDMRANGAIVRFLERLV
jgi:folate-binding protein YgfZ